MHSELILASTSIYRKVLLGRLGLPFRCVAPGVDEDDLKQECLEPADLAERLAAAKAEAVARRFPQSVVIGSDQLATIDGEVLGKPGTQIRAVEQLQRLAGRTHDLITAVCVMRLADGFRRNHADRTRLTVRKLGHDEILRYVTGENPVDCAGSYKIESAGIALFDRIESDDFTAITGLPLITLVSILRDFGYHVP